jgi:hypothetical protein
MRGRESPRALKAKVRRLCLKMVFMRSRFPKKPAWLMIKPGSRGVNRFVSKP